MGSGGFRRGGLRGGRIWRREDMGHPATSVVIETVSGRIRLHVDLRHPRRRLCLLLAFGLRWRGAWAGVMKKPNCLRCY